MIGAVVKICHRCAAPVGAWQDTARADRSVEWVESACVQGTEQRWLIADGSGDRLQQRAGAVDRAVSRPQELQHSM